MTPVIQVELNVMGRGRSAIVAALITLGMFLALPYLELLSTAPGQRKIISGLNTAHLAVQPPPPVRPKRMEEVKARRPRKLPKPSLKQKHVRPLPLSAAWNLDMTLGDVGGDFDLNFALTPDTLVQAVEDSVFSVEDLDRSPQPLVRLHPVYPLQARMRGQEGSVVVEFIVDTNGETRDIKVLLAQPGDVFVSAAHRAIARWRFKPGLKGGEAVPVRVRQKVTFRLER